MFTRDGRYLSSYEEKILAARERVRTSDADHARGIVSVTDAEAQALLAARFPKGHSIGCDCGDSKGRIKPADCEGMSIRDGEGKLMARFATKEFACKQADDGSILIFRRPSATADSNLTPQQLHSKRLRQMNQEAEQFYRRGGDL